MNSFKFIILLALLSSVTFNYFQFQEFVECKSQLRGVEMKYQEKLSQKQYFEFESSLTLTLDSDRTLQYHLAGKEELFVFGITRSMTSYTEGGSDSEVHLIHAESVVLTIEELEELTNSEIKPTDVFFGKWTINKDNLSLLREARNIAR